MRIIYFFILFMVLQGLSCISPGEKAQLAKPSPQQYSWHEQERIMFIHFGMATWQGREYDNFSTDLKKVNPSKINTDEWCRIAQSWGAKQIVFVAKHVGGFCWWPTETTEYNVKNIAWKDGNGDLVAEIAASCKKFGLNLGLYLYPGDDKWGAGLGSGGRTNDTTKQEAYNKIYRQQLTELLTRYGKIKEVWFDGTCVIDVQDILAENAREAVIFQSPQATIRWVGNEAGFAPYPAWNSLYSTDLKSGVATAVQGTPDGDAWAPLECDVPLYNHNWFWSKANENKRRNVDDLMEIYYKSAGRGALLLLNATPDTAGVIPEGDVKQYAAFGKEIERRFGQPLKMVNDKKGKEVTISFDEPTVINHVVIMEDYREGERIRAYDVEGYAGDEWKRLSSGSSVGRKKIDYFEDIAVTKVRLTITQSVAEPLIRSFSLYKIDNTPELKYKEEAVSKDWQYLNSWMPEMFSNGKASINLNLTSYIPVPGQYEVLFKQTEGKSVTAIDKAELFYDGEKTLPEFITIKDNNIFINRTAQVTNETSILLKVTFSATGENDSKGSISFRAAYKHN